MRCKLRRSCLKRLLPTINPMRRTVVLLTLLAAPFFATGCGYHVAGRAGNLPSEWKTIAVPAFKNDTARYRIEQRFTAAVIRQFIQRTKYRIVQNPESANPVLFNATTGQVTTMLVTVHTKVQLVDTSTQKVVYKNDDMLFRDEYQISTDVQSFFEERDLALEG